MVNKISLAIAILICWLIALVGWSLLGQSTGVVIGVVGVIIAAALISLHMPRSSRRS